MDKILLEDKIAKVIATVTAPESAFVDMSDWDWFQGVALFALYQYAVERNDEGIIAYLYGWFDAQIAKGLPQKNINTMCPLLTLACLSFRTENATYLAILSEWAEFLMRTLPRTEENGFQHLCIDNPNRGQLWADTIFMSVLFIAKTGLLLDRQEYIDESVRQYLVHIKYLSDTRTGLMFHAWTFEGRNNFGRVLWARGNSWYTAGLVDYLGMVPNIGEGVKNYLLSTLGQQINALAATQDASGLWHTVLDDPSSYLETSASCAFAYGILKAVRLGFVSAKYRKTALDAIQAVIGKISQDGVVQGVSGGTRVGLNVDFYKKIPLGTMPYGQSMAFLSLVEALNHL